MARWTGLVLAFTVVLAACGGSGADDDAAATSNPASTTSRPASSTSSTQPEAKPVEGDSVEVQDFSFHPEKLLVSVGTTVTWTNKDPATHTASADDGLFDTKSMQPGTSHTFTFERAGTFAYHCNIHPTMTAAIIVR